MTHGGGYPAGAGVPHDDDDDYRNAAETASRAAGDSGDSSFFSSLLGSLTEKKSQVANEDIDEDGPSLQPSTLLHSPSQGTNALPYVTDAVQQHKSFFGSNPEPETASPKSMGSAAAMQALKLFNSGASQGKSTSQSTFIALAMAEASKLFDSQASKGKVEGGASKESAVMQAGEMALKMYMKSQGTGGSAGGSSGLGGLMGMASKFM